jgi:hypothetical protein
VPEQALIENGKCLAGAGWFRSRWVWETVSEASTSSASAPPQVVQRSGLLSNHPTGFHHDLLPCHGLNLSRGWSGGPNSREPTPCDLALGGVDAHLRLAVERLRRPGHQGIGQLSTLRRRVVPMISFIRALFHELDLDVLGHPSRAPRTGRRLPPTSDSQLGRSIAMRLDGHAASRCARHRASPARPTVMFAHTR